MSFDLHSAAATIANVASVEISATVALNNVVASLKAAQAAMGSTADQDALQSAIDSINQATPALSAAIASVPSTATPAPSAPTSTVATAAAPASEPVATSTAPTT